MAAAVPSFPRRIQPHHDREQGHLRGHGAGGHVERAQRHHEERHAHRRFAQAAGPQVHRGSGVEPGQQDADRPQDDHRPAGVEHHGDRQQGGGRGDAHQDDPALPLGHQAGVELVAFPVQLPEGLGGHQVALGPEALVVDLGVYARHVVEVVVGEVDEKRHHQHGGGHQDHHVPRRPVGHRADDPAHRRQHERERVAEPEYEVEAPQRRELPCVRSFHGPAMPRSDKNGSPPASDPVEPGSRRRFAGGGELTGLTGPEHIGRRVEKNLSP